MRFIHRPGETDYRLLRVSGTILSWIGVIGVVLVVLLLVTGLVTSFIPTEGLRLSPWFNLSFLTGLVWVLPLVIVGQACHALADIASRVSRGT